MTIIAGILIGPAGLKPRQGIFTGKAQAAWERHPAFVTFNEFPEGTAINGNGIHDDDMESEGGFASGYRDETYPYTHNGSETFEVTAWIRNSPHSQKLINNSFRVFISNMTDCGQDESRRTVVLDFTSRSAELAPGDNSPTGDG